MGILSRVEKRLIESHLRRYDTYRNTVDDYFASVDESGQQERVGGRASVPGKPTERAVIGTLEPPTQVRDAMRWIQVHQMTRDRLSPEKREFMERVFYRGQAMIGVISGMHIEERTFYRWSSDVIATFAICAAIKGMLVADSKTVTVFRENSVV